MSHLKENKVIIDGQTYYGGLHQPNLQFIKVNVDCWDKIFDLLSLRDIFAMSQTCQRMRQMGGHYFRENFRGANLEAFPNPQFTNYNVEADIDFLRFVDTILIDWQLEKFPGHLGTDLWRSLTTLHLHYLNLNESDLHRFANIRNKLENVAILNCFVKDDFVGKFISLCPELKRLKICGVHCRSAAAENRFFGRTYPMLTHFEYLQCPFFGEALMASKLTPFLVRNSNIKHFRIDDRNLLEMSFATSAIRLDRLIVDVCDSETNKLTNRLKMLHKNGYFQTLRLTDATDFSGSDRDSILINDMTSFSALDVFVTFNFYPNICQLSQLKELHLMDVTSYVDLDVLKAIAVNLKNLERLCIRGEVKQLEPFFRYSKKLEMVIFKNRRYSHDPLDLLNLNEIRRKGGMQRKVKLGVSEWLYLPTKWMANNANLHLVEIIRKSIILEHFHAIEIKN